ncbi:MAG: transposase [Gammaproteobacteria bacterium]|nr:transposase [Gammaproteobacteria bacterium]
MIEWVMRLYRALKEWEQAAARQLLQMPVLHADETSLRINRNNHWMHSHAPAHPAVKFMHRKRGQAAIEAISVIPRYGAARSRDREDGKEEPKPVLVHDRWASCFKYDHCDHGLCGAHLLRDLQFIIDAHSHRWAERMQKLPVNANREVTASEHKALDPTPAPGVART